MHTYNGNKDILILSEGLIDGLDDTTIMAETKYSVTITKSRKKNLLSLHYNAANSFLYSNSVKIYQFKAKYFKTKPYPLCLGKISRDFLVDRIGLKGSYTIFLYRKY